MDPKLERVRQLEDRARSAPTLAEAQALNSEADRLRGGRQTASREHQPLIRN